MAHVHTMTDKVGSITWAQVGNPNEDPSGIQCFNVLGITTQCLGRFTAFNRSILCLLDGPLEGLLAFQPSKYGANRWHIISAATGDGAATNNFVHLFNEPGGTS